MDDVFTWVFVGRRQADHVNPAVDETFRDAVAAMAALDECRADLRAEGALSAVLRRRAEQVAVHDVYVPSGRTGRSRAAQRYRRDEQQRRERVVRAVKALAVIARHPAPVRTTLCTSKGVSATTAAQVAPPAAPAATSRAATVAAAPAASWSMLRPRSRA